MEWGSSDVLTSDSCCLVFVFYLTTSFFFCFLCTVPIYFFNLFPVGNEQLPLASHHAIPCFLPGVHSATSFAPGISWKHNESNYQRRQASRLSRWRPNCAVGMLAQVSKFGENKPFTNRNVCFGGRNKLLAAHETFVSRFKTNLFCGQKAHIGVSRSNSQFDKMLTGCDSM